MGLFDSLKYKKTKEGNLIEAKKGIVHAKIPNGVKTIKCLAFKKSEATLQSLTLSDSVQEIESCAFDTCRNLSSIKFNEGLKRIGCNFDNARITELTIPNSVRNLNGFSDCPYLTSVNLGNGVEAIESFTLSSCKMLTSITIPTSVKSIEHGAFNKVKTFNYRGTKEQWETIKKVHYRKFSSLTEEGLKQKYNSSSGLTVEINHEIFKVSDPFDDRTIAKVIFNGTSEEWNKADKASVISEIVKEEEKRAYSKHDKNIFYLYVISAFSLPKGATINFEYKGD